MRRGRRGTEDSIDAVEEKSEPEFARFKLKKTGSTARSIDEKETEGASSELRMKLMKQKSVADGISGNITHIKKLYFLNFYHSKIISIINFTNHLKSSAAQ